MMTNKCIQRFVFSIKKMDEDFSIYFTDDIDKLEEEDRVALLEIIEKFDYSKMLFYDSYIRGEKWIYKFT